MRTFLAVLATPIVWVLMLMVSTIASFPLSWIVARNMTKKSTKEIVSMVNDPVA